MIGVSVRNAHRFIRRMPEGDSQSPKSDFARIIDCLSSIDGIINLYTGLFGESQGCAATIIDIETHLEKPGNPSLGWDSPASFSLALWERVGVRAYFQQQTAALAYVVSIY